MAASDGGPGPGPGGPPPEEPGVPPSVLRSWDEAEAALFPLVMAQPELYEQALGAVQRLLGQLRETCQDLPALLAAHERGGDLLAELPRDAAAGVPGVRPGLLAAAACATRYRELVAQRAATARLEALTRARAQGLSWAVVEESGQPERGMGEDPDLIVAGCRRAIDLGVYPFVVPLRPTVGSLMEDLVAPSPEYCETIYRRVVPYLRARGIGAHTAAAGCARCQACSGMSLLEERTDADGRTFLPLVSHG